MLLYLESNPGRLCAFYSANWPSMRCQCRCPQACTSQKTQGMTPLLQLCHVVCTTHQRSVLQVLRMHFQDILYSVEKDDALDIEEPAYEPSASQRKALDIRGELPSTLNALQNSQHKHNGYLRPPRSKWMLSSASTASTTCLSQVILRSSVPVVWIPCIDSPYTIHTHNYAYIMHTCISHKLYTYIVIQIVYKYLVRVVHIYRIYNLLCDHRNGEMAVGQI